MDQPPITTPSIVMHNIDANDEVMIDPKDKEQHWKVLDRIRRKMEEDKHLKSVFNCLNNYNRKNKKNLITFMMIIEYMRTDEDGNRLALVDRYRYTLFSSLTPKYTDRLDGGKISEIPVHIQLMIGRITGYETNQKMDHLMFDISGASLPSNNMYKKMEQSGLFNTDICYTGIIGNEGKYEEIPKKFSMLR